MTRKLVLLRHGQSQWNLDNRFTGWVDVDLTEQGRREAAAAGKLMREEGLQFDVAHTSVLKRAIRTLWIIMAALWIGSLVYIRIIKPLYLLTRPYKVAEVIPERGEASTLVIRPDGHRGMTFKPGQFVWLTVGSLPLFLSEHPFSISSSAMKNGAVELTIKKLGDWSSRVSEIKPGTRA